ncbi:MAG: YciI family protein [Pseudolabrys sp.]
MPHFFLKLIAPRPTFAIDMTENEKKLMQQHAIYWKGRQDKGEVVVFGPVMDSAGPYGVGVIEAAGEAAARAFADNDPVAKAGLAFAARFHRCAP